MCSMDSFGSFVFQDISRIFILEVTKFAECIGKEPRSRKLAMQHAQEVVSRLDGSPTFSDLPWKLRLTDFSSANGKSPVQIRPFPSGWSRFRQHFTKVVPNQD